jgi:signal peptidase I
MNESNERNESFFAEMVRFALITLAIVLPIRLFIAEPFIVSGASMEPTFNTGDYLIIDQLSYRFEEPKRGEVIIFRYPKDPNKYFIKRIIGLPGETVVLDGNTITIKNKLNPEGFQLDQSYISYASNESLTHKLGKDQYFVMGDNRPASSDSRVWGPLPTENIVGRAFVRLFPPSVISLLPGDHHQTE